MLEKMIIASFIALSSLSATAPVKGYIPEPIEVKENEVGRVPICHNDGIHNYGIQMTKKKEKIASSYKRAKPCIHHYGGEDRVTYQDYLNFYECPECGYRTGEYETTEEVKSECFGFELSDN